MLRTLDWAKLKAATAEAAVTTIAILLIVAGAKIFGKAITLYRIPQDLSTFITANFESAGLFILAVSAVLLVMGLVLEALSMMLIMVPVLSGSLAALGHGGCFPGVTT